MTDTEKLMALREQLMTEISNLRAIEARLLTIAVKITPQGDTLQAASPFPPPPMAGGLTPRSDGTD